MPTNHGVTACVRCRGRIRWAITEAGKRQAVNADEAADGNLACYTDGTQTLRVRVLTKERPNPDHLEWRGMPHAATCTPPTPIRTVPVQRRAPAGVARQGGKVLRPAPGRWGR